MSERDEYIPDCLDEVKAHLDQHENELEHVYTVLDELIEFKDAHKNTNPNSQQTQAARDKKQSQAADKSLVAIAAFDLLYEDRGLTKKDIYETLSNKFNLSAGRIKTILSELHTSLEAKK